MYIYIYIRREREGVHTCSKLPFQLKLNKNENAKKAKVMHLYISSLD